MIVYVVMGNDYPSAVFSDEAAAEHYVAAKNEETEDGSYRRIYWRSYNFELDSEKES